MEGFEVLPTILSIVVVLAVLGATLLLLRWATASRGGARRGRGTSSIEVVERQSIGRSSSLVLVRYNGTELLLGVTESTITQVADSVIDLRETREPEETPRPRVRPSTALETLRAKTVRR